MVAVGIWGRHGATHDLAQWGVSRNGQESVMAVGWFCQNTVGPPEWEQEAMGFVVWVKCANLCRVRVKSIDSCVLGHGHKFIVGHTIGSWSKWRINLLITYVITKM